MRVPWARQAQEAPPPSGYLTLIPLSDARLQPRDTRLTAAWLLLFALFVAGAVFVTVSRMLCSQACARAAVFGEGAHARADMTRLAWLHRCCCLMVGCRCHAA